MILPQRLNTNRHGAVLPMVTVSLIGLISFVALAIDLGLMTVAHTSARLPPMPLHWPGAERSTELPVTTSLMRSQWLNPRQPATVY